MASFKSVSSRALLSRCLAAAVLVVLATPCLGRTALAEGRVAYLAVSDGYWQVWTMSPDGSGERQVTRSDYEKAQISWHPDGRHLLVSGLDGEVRWVDVEDGSEQALKLHATVDAAMSPDGSHIAFSAAPGGGRDANEIWLAQRDGSGLRKLTTMKRLQHEPAWSADGSWIYFLSGDGGQAHDIWRVSPKTGAAEQLTVASLYHFELALSAADQLAFSSNRSGNYEIWTWDPAGTLAPRKLTDHAAVDGHPSWAPDASALVFHSARGGTLNIWRIDADGKGLAQLTHHANGARNPHWWRPRTPRSP